MPTDLALKNKKIIYAIIGVAVLLLCFKYIYNNRDVLFSKPDVPSGNGIDLQRKLDQETIEKTASFISAEDAAQCDQVDRIVDGINYKTVCLDNIYLSLSEKNLDYDVCAKLINGSVEDCQKRVMLLILSKEKTLGVCDKVPEKLKQFCPDAYWNFMAASERDPSLCGKTSSSQANNDCQNNLLLVLASQKESLKCSSFTDSVVLGDCKNYLEGKEKCRLIDNRQLKKLCL